MNRAHPIHANDADSCCRWLCLSAGLRTNQDNAEIAKALEALPFQGKPLQLPKTGGR